MKKLSIVIPAFNEAKYITELIQKILQIPTEEIGYNKEIIFVDDGSTDNTFELAQKFSQVRCFKQGENQGKGKAVQRGIFECTGDFILVQDADLEYEPNDYIPMLRQLNGRDNVAVYGSRILGQIKLSGRKFPFPGKNKNQNFGPWFASIVLSFWTYILFQKWISDTLTAYKIYPTENLKKMNLKTSGFESDHEITARLIRSKVRIEEVPIFYKPRNKEEGKKIRTIDGFIAIWTLLKYRIVNDNI
jgi:dolichol-phosphate mannosyltransferase